ncbi:MAG: hypothetical protein LBL43_07925 [Treponema sp.]|jgi:hypothetical protein|nr:hypothetical protein [Treponema sp.]
MKLVYTALFDRQRKEVIARYPRFREYFDETERRILKEPFASAEEPILFGEKHIHARKRYIKTTFFSGLLRDQYLYLTLTYMLTADDKIVILFLTMKTYID